MSLCGTVVVVKKKRKRRHNQKCNSDCESDDSDDSSSPLSYTYTNCDSVAILNENQQPLLRRLESDDDETSSPPPFRWLNWRMDPIKTFSDWMIDVVVVQRRRNASVAFASSSIASHRYHVHKNVLVVESELFQNLFYKHQQPRDPLLVFTATQITLSNEFEANVFPTLLDYMYSPGSIWINQQNAITLLLLSNYLGMRRLKWLTKQFLKRHACKNPDEATAYVSESLCPTKLDRPLRKPPHVSEVSASCFGEPLNPLSQREPKTMTKHELVSNTSSQTSFARAREYSDADLRMVLSKRLQYPHSNDGNLEEI